MGWTAHSSYLLVMLMMAPAMGYTQRDGTKESRAVKAQAYLTLATSLFKDKDFEGALDSLQRAEPLVVDTTVLPLVRFNIARCYEELGLPIEALAAYRRYLETGEGVERRQKRAHASIKALRSRYVGRLVVNCAPKDAEVRLVGSEKKREGCPADFGDILAQEYSIDVSKAGYTSQQRTAVVVPAQATRIRIALPREKPKTALDSATSIDAQIVVERETSSPHLHWWLWGSAGITAVSGAVFHSLAINDAGAIENQPPGDRRNDTLDTFESKRMVTLGLYGVSLALITAALLNGPSDEDPDLSLISVGPKGVHARLSF